MTRSPDGAPHPQRLAGRLAALAGELGETPEAVAATLHEELLNARSRIDAALSAEDPRAAGEGAHAARNSALMLDAEPLLDGLRVLQIAADAGDLAALHRRRTQVAGDLERLIEALRRLR